MKLKSKKVRLGYDVAPHRYTVTLKPDLEAFTFEGNEVISLTLKKSTKTITLHSADIEILSVEYRWGKKQSTGAVTYNEAHETATFTFSDKLPKGRGSLSIAFIGILNDQMKGFYRSRYEHNGKVEHMAVTQFESTDARRAIPCFDEPAHKAIFDVSLIVPNDRTAISNTLETSIKEHGAGYKLVSFAPSPKMSTYLLAFIVGHFEHIEKKTKRGILVRVFVTPGKKHQAEFALDCAVRCIDFYEKYFGIKYPLPVADLIAIPDFSAGAMENWGAVTYRETAVLIDPVHSATANKQRVALVIAHELAHQWFGNLVTMEWWTHLWLNEGFATYLEYVAVAHVYPEWDIWSQFVYQETGRALTLDGLISTHPIEVDVHHPSEISEVFDAISYAKGAAIIRMLAHYIGEPAFKKGLSHYLKKHAYKNAVTEDLWRAFEQASGKKVRALMQRWTHVSGYPLVTATQKGTRLLLSQSRFVSTPHKALSGSWTIPMTAHVAGKSQKLLLKKKHAIKNPKGVVKLNLGETTFMRAAYDSNLRALLAGALAHNAPYLETADRYGIIRDAFALAESGKLGVADVLALLQAYRTEKTYVVWAVIAEYIHKLELLLFKTDADADFALFVRTLTDPIVSEVGWHATSGEAHDVPLLRSTVLMLAANAHNQSVIKKARELCARALSGAHVDPNLRAVSYYVTAKHGGKEEYAHLLKAYHGASMEEEKDRLLRALCSTKDQAALKHRLEEAFSSKARGQDSLKAMTFVWTNPYGRDVAWTYLKENWDMIVKKFEGGHLFPRLLQPASTENDEARAKEIESFIARHGVAGIKRTADQVVEQIRTHAAWLKRDLANIQKYLRT